VISSGIIDFGIFLVLAGLAAAIVMVARVARMVKAHLPGMQLEIGQVNRAVNRVGDGELTLIEQVREIRSTVKCMSDEMRNIDSRLVTLEHAVIPKTPPSQDTLL
jgi:hypothetical protein